MTMPRATFLGDACALRDLPNCCSPVEACDLIMTTNPPDGVLAVALGTRSASRTVGSMGDSSEWEPLHGQVKRRRLFAPDIAVGVTYEDVPALVAQIKENRTTKDEAQSIMGDPNAVSFPQDDEVWTYTYCKMTMRPTNWIPYVNTVAGAYDAKSVTVTVIFEAKGVVKYVAQGRMEGGGGGIQDLGR